MKVRIGMTGFLNIDRGTRGTPQWKMMLCPFTADSDGEQLHGCGDWCPHFSIFTTSTMVEITICHGKRIVIPIEQFVDERP